MDGELLQARQPQGQPAAHVLPFRDNNMVWQRHTRWSLGGAVRRLKVHDGIVKEVLALELLRRKQVRLALEVAHKGGPRHLSVAVHAPVLAFHGRHQREQTICRLPLRFVLEQLPQGSWGRVETAVMTDLVEVYAAQ